MPSRNSRAVKKAADIYTTAPWVALTRTMHMWAAGPGSSQGWTGQLPRFGAEKASAYRESMTSMGNELLRMNQQWAWWALRSYSRLWTAPWQWWLPSRPAAQARTGARHLYSSVGRLADAGLSPVHRRVMGNARRLAKPRKR